MVISEDCRQCLLRKNINKYPEHAAPAEIQAYQNAVRDIIEHCDGLSTPQIAEKMYSLRNDLFGYGDIYSEIKRHFNDLMLTLLPYMEKNVKAASDQLKMAVQYAMAGNYIDFGALAKVDENDLRRQLDEAADIAIDPAMLDSFREELLRAHRLVYFTDNCGEIVTDKLLISTIRRLNPDMRVTVIVRGKPAVNDATMEDAVQVRMEEAAHRVIGNGTGMPGNVLGAISDEAMSEIKAADLLVAKGQGNYEGLSECGLNIFYLFLCKCELFTRRFNVPQFTGIMTREQK